MSESKTAHAARFAVGRLNQCEQRCIDLRLKLEAEMFKCRDLLLDAQRLIGEMKPEEKSDPYNGWARHWESIPFSAIEACCKPRAE